MGKYDFDSMGALWVDQARKIVENGVFVSHEGNWDLWHRVQHPGSWFRLRCFCVVSFVRIAAASVPLARRMWLYEFDSVILAERKHRIFARSWHRVK